MGDSGAFGSQKTMNAIYQASKNVKPTSPKFQGKGTRARLNTAAQKMFNQRTSK